MSNLLDLASIVLTPTAYNNGEALCVKPDDGSGDFDFSRNSAATRVNAQGLVENVQILSSNLVQNGDFSEEGVQEVSNGSFSQEGSELVTNGDFSVSTGWQGLNADRVISDGKLNISQASGFAVVYQTETLTVGTYYKCVVEVSNYVDGSFKIGLAGSDAANSSPSINADGTFTFYLQRLSGGSNNVGFVFGGLANLSIDNFSVREVGQDWTLGTGWSIGEDKAISDGVSSNSNLVTTSAFYSGSLSVKMTINVTDYVSGGLKIYLSSTNFTEITANGDYTFYTTADRTDGKMYLKSVNFNGSVTNISVKEVGQNWTLGSGISIGSNEAVFASTPSGQSVGQNAVAAALPNGALAKVSFEVLTRTEGTFGIYFSGTLVGTLASAGVFTGYFTKGTETSFYIRALGTTSGTISNINVIQITTDTNLPRINYEGFSYQDVLGSEEVVNGGFDNGGSNWSNIGNEAVFENSSVIFENNAKIYQNVVSDLSKEYNVEIEFSSISGNGIQLLVGNGNSFVSYSVSDIINNGNKINIAKESFIGSGILFIYSQNSDTSATITNVSVKEYLGQSVVPDSGCGSWLWEPQSTNLLAYSSDYTQWNKSGSMVITPNNAISPDGTQNASLLTANAANQFIYLSAFAAANSTISLYIKRKTGTGDIELSNNGGSSYTILSVTDEWNRVQVTFAAGTNQTVIKINTSGDEIYLWGAQLEALSYASSLIPTEGSTVTRNQDVCTNGGGLASINSTEGVLYAEIAALADDGTNRRISLAKDGNNKINLVLSTASNTIQSIVIVQAAVQFLDSFVISDTTQFFKVALKYKQNDFALWVNGVKVATDTSGNTFQIGELVNLTFDNGNGNNPFFGKTKAVAVWKEALTDAELTELTTI